MQPAVPSKPIRILVAMLFLFAAVPQGFSQPFIPSYHTEPILVDGVMKIDMPFPYVFDRQLFKGLKKANDKLVYMAVLGVEPEYEGRLFCFEVLPGKRTDHSGS